MAGSKGAVVAALIGNFVIALLKLATGLYARSAAMLAEAAHSFSDTGNQVLLLIGIHRAERPPSPEHPYGGAKSAYFWPFLVAVLLFGVAGAYSVIEGIDKIRHPHPLEDIRLALGVLAIAFVIEAVVWVVAVRTAIRRGRASGIRNIRQFMDENRDASLLTVIVEDTLALVGLPIAAGALLLSRYTGNPVWDGIGSLAIGLLLMGFALFLAKEVQSLIIGRGLGRQDLEVVHRILREDPGIERVLAVQSVYFAPDVVLLGAEVDVLDTLDVAEVEDTVARVERELTDALPHLKYVYVEPRARPSGSALARGRVHPHGAHEPD